jgi:hypothetical protein
MTDFTSTGDFFNGLSALTHIILRKESLQDDAVSFGITFVNAMG